MGLKLEEISPGAVLPILTQAQWLCAVFGKVLSCWVGIPILSACLCLPQPCVRLNAGERELLMQKSPLSVSGTSFSSGCMCCLKHPKCSSAASLQFPFHSVH